MADIWYDDSLGMQQLKDTISSKGTKAEKRKKRTTVLLKDLLRTNEFCNTIEYIWVKVNEQIKTIQLLSTLPYTIRKKIWMKPFQSKLQFCQRVAYDPRQSSCQPLFTTVKQWPLSA